MLDERIHLHCLVLLPVMPSSPQRGRRHVRRLQVRLIYRHEHNVSVSSLPTHLADTRVHVIAKVSNCARTRVHPETTIIP